MDERSGWRRTAATPSPPNSLHRKLKFDTDEFRANHFQLKGHPSAFDLLPYLDKIRAATFDPMHLVLIGLMKVFCKEVYIEGHYGNAQDPQTRPKKMSKADQKKADATNRALLDNALGLADAPAEEDMANLQERLSEQARRDEQADTAKRKALYAVFRPEDVHELTRLMTEVTVPTHWKGMTRQFFEKGTESPTADDWRVYAEAFGPLCLIELWGLYGVGTIRAYEKQRRIFNPKMDMAHLDMMMDLLSIIHLLFRPTVSEKQITEATDIIRRFTKASTELHPGVKGIWNLHWLSHLPEDIRNFGPVYSFWCFASERFNKTLKNINSNGHIKQTPMIMMRVFQHYAHLRQISAFGYQAALIAGDAITTVAQSLKRVYDQWGRDLDGTKEQQLATLWEADQGAAESDLETQSGPTIAPRMILDSGSRAALDRFNTARLHRYLCRSRAGDDDDATAPTFLQENERPSVSNPGNTFRGGSQAVNHKSITVQRKRFGPFKGTIVDNVLPPDDMTLCRDSFIEFRSQEDIHASRYHRCPVALITRIFSHTTTSLDRMSTVTRTFIVLRHLKPYQYAQSAPYHWARYKHFNIWTWHAGELEQEVVMDVNTIRWVDVQPVSIKAVLKNPSVRSTAKIWVTMAMTHLA